MGGRKTTLGGVVRTLGFIVSVVETVFFTREEAEQALERMKGDS